MVTATEKKEPDLEIRKKHFVELIRLVSMQPEQLDPILPVMVHQALAHTGIRNNIERITKIVKERVTREEFIEQFFAPFADTFSQDEILQLIGFYKNQAMRKFLKQSMKLYHPLFEAYRRVVSEVAEEMDRKRE